jgi:FtsP/CotA-like multicopper oxidase with cupredoxin domain
MQAHPTTLGGAAAVGAVFGLAITAAVHLYDRLPDRRGGKRLLRRHEDDRGAAPSVRSFMIRTVLAVVLAFCSLPGCRRSPELAEFAGSYPSHASPTGVTREFSLVAAPSKIPLFEGQPLDVWAYNGQVPGPTLRVRLGETVRAVFTNQLAQPTTIHWHGVRVPNAMDGVPWVTQPPVMPGETFIYEFTPKDAGTFWFHPHLRSSEQVERGLFGVLIVEDENPAPYSRDELWVLDDWLLDRDGQIYPEFNTRHDLAHDGRWGNVVTVNGRRMPRMEVRPGERIRLRLLNVANGRVFSPDFSALDAKAIAVDGLYAARPFDPQGFEIAPGNRLDLDITLPSSAAGRQFTIVDRFTRREIPLAQIFVTGDPVDTPRFESPAHGHVPAWKTPLEMLPICMEFRLNARSGGPFGIEWTINDAAMDHTTHALPATLPHLPLGAFSRLRFVNDSYRIHPMHIHGLFFKVLGRNGTPVDEPHFRDTALMHPKETVDIGTVPEDVGRWMLHCHILEHAEAGMMTAVEVR